MALPARVEVRGYASGKFEPVRQAFADSFSLRNLRNRATAAGAALRAPAKPRLAVWRSCRFRLAGAVGSLCFAYPPSSIGFAYVTNRMGVKITSDPQEVALRVAPVVGV